MHLGERTGGSHCSDRRLQFVLPSTNDISVAAHHRIETDLGNVSRVILWPSCQRDFGGRIGGCNQNGRYRVRQPAGVFDYWELWLRKFKIYL
jgi:hypothetical protein